MLTVEMNEHGPSAGGITASSINENDLFRDGEGDLHLRLEEGCIMIGEADLWVYTEEELGEHDFFDRCSPVVGKVTFSVKFGGENI